MIHSRGFEKTGTASKTLGERQDGWDFERNELTSVPGVGCKPITVIFARGTIELGNVGKLVGPPFFKDLHDLMIGADNIAVQGVNYAATIAGYLIGGDPGGAHTTADLLKQAARNCPDTQILLSGYSQGAMEVHLGEAMVSAEVVAQIAAIISRRVVWPMSMETILICSNRWCLEIHSRSSLPERGSKQGHDLLLQ